MQANRFMKRMLLTGAIRSCCYECACQWPMLTVAAMHYGMRSCCYKYNIWKFAGFFHECAVVMLDGS